MPNASIFTVLYRLKKKGSVNNSGISRPVKWKAGEKLLSEE
jgi:hypothetical protein